jgi:hypothetical protein
MFQALSGKVNGSYNTFVQPLPSAFKEVEVITILNLGREAKLPQNLDSKSLLSRTEKFSRNLF